ncbi:MAG: translation initiation factor IF-2 [Patescibacteria group bacterium]|nr:translation initiation factor IF-2 [Patescibacteria group bacterium]
MKNKKDETTKNLIVRPPVVTILGHVDHGKTSLLDAIRHTNVTAREHGGITQHIGAYQVEVNGRKITFIDTPGHAAFSQMRARGAIVTDIAILVVAADDGVMPQTKESIAHIKAANVPMIVAINKTDLETANIEKVKQQLAENEVFVEGYGGDVVTVNISAKTKAGISELLEMILLVADMQELKADPEASVEGVVIESSLDRFRGSVATILVQTGTLRTGGYVVIGKAKGKIRGMVGADGKPAKEAGPSTPVEILGLESVPDVGEKLLLQTAVLSAKKDQEITKELAERPGLELLGQPERVEIRIIIKADVAGSLEAISTAIEALETETQKVKFIHRATGEISESDVMLAASTKALIIGFNVKTSIAASKLAEEEKVNVRVFNIIYELLDELKEGLEALAKPKITEEVLGKATVIALFEAKGGKVAGCKMIEGAISKGNTIRVKRDQEEIGRSRIKSMRHLQEEISKTTDNMEFGLVPDAKLDFTIGDIIEAVKIS